MKKAIKVITIAAILATATTSYGLSEEWEAYYTLDKKIRDAYYEALRTVKPEDRKSLKSAYCVDDVSNRLVTIRKIQTKRGSTEKEIKEAVRKEFMDKFINYEDYEAAKLASIRGEYFEYLEMERKWKLCYLNAYEELTGERI